VHQPFSAGDAPDYASHDLASCHNNRYDSGNRVTCREIYSRFQIPDYRLQTRALLGFGSFRVDSVRRSRTAWTNPRSYWPRIMVPHRVRSGRPGWPFFPPGWRLTSPIIAIAAILGFLADTTCSSRGLPWCTVPGNVTEVTGKSPSAHGTDLRNHIKLAPSVDFHRCRARRPLLYNSESV
jgi:hypothetical protein